MENNNIDDREVAELKKLLGDIPADEDSALPGMRNQASASRTANSDPGATQRVSISRATQATQAQHSRPQAPAPRNSNSAASEKKTQRKKRERIMVISLFSVAAILLIAIAIVVAGMLKKPEDDNLIMSNTFAAGVNLGGMTKEQAKNAIQQATKDTYSKLDMTVTVLDTTVTLTPADTGAALNVDAIVEAAYSRGRSGELADHQSQTTYQIPLLPHLSLDIGYIRSEITKLGKKYGTTLTQPSHSIEGQAPSLDLPEKDTTIVYQTLTIHIGTAEYGLNTEQLYNQIMDAYNSNLFNVTGECTVVPPSPVNCDEIFKKYCTAPVDAVFDPDTYSVTPEIYGYGFDLAALKTMVSAAEYGTTLEIPLKFIRPTQTAEDLSGDNFRDVLATHRTPLSADANYNRNLLLACNALHNMILKPGDTFSFNTAVGQPALNKGFKTADVYVGKEILPQVGGGISQVASTLYYCALMADLQITERVNHAFVPSFIDAGMDADINYGVFDLCFTNNSGYPIRIEATIEDDFVVINLVGTDNNDYVVKIEYVVDKTYDPITLFVTMPSGNPGGYYAGDILIEAITGYSISTYRCVYSKDTDTQISKDLLAESFYDKQNKVVVEIQTEIDPDPTDPIDPTDSSESSESTVPSTAPSKPTVPTTKPTNSTVPTTGRN